MSLDVMIDLETVGTSAGCGILSIGACTFNHSHTFYKKIDLESCKLIGLTEDQDTMAWWRKQDPEAKREAFSGTNSIVEVLGNFSDWFRRLPGDADKIFVWGNGADFDLPILAAAYAAAKMQKPWKPFNGRCYRTLKNLYFSVKMQPFDGMKHNALADAKNQASHARNILRIHFADE